MCAHGPRCTHRRGGCHCCGGSASLDRGTLTLKFGMDPAENDGMRAGILTRIGVALTLCAVAAPISAQARMHHGRHPGLGHRGAFRPTTWRCTRSGAASYGVPWQLLAAVGSVESRHGRDPGALRAPHARRARPDAVPGRLQQGRAARRCRRQSGLRRHLGHLPQVVGPSAVPHGRRRRRDRGGRGQARLRLRAADGFWPRALWRYNALHSYRKTVLRRAALLGMNSACGLLVTSEQRLARKPADARWLPRRSLSQPERRISSGR